MTRDKYPMSVRSWVLSQRSKIVGTQGSPVVGRSASFRARDHVAHCHVQRSVEIAGDPEAHGVLGAGLADDQISGGLLATTLGLLGGLFLFPSHVGLSYLNGSHSFGFEVEDSVTHRRGWRPITDLSTV